MATGNFPTSHASEIEDPQHTVFRQHFNPSQQQWMMQEDLYSGKTVSLVLVSIVTMGLIGMIFTVLATLR